MWSEDQRDLEHSQCLLVCTTSFIHIWICIYIYFYVTPECVKEEVSDCYTRSCGSFYFSAGLTCPTLIWWFSFYLIFHFVMFCCYHLEACSSLLRDQKRVGPEQRRGGEELRRAKGRETIQIILYEKIVYD